MHISEELKAANARALEAETQLAVAVAQVEGLNIDNQRLVAEVTRLAEHAGALEKQIEDARELAASYTVKIEEAAAEQAAHIVAQCGVEQPEIETSESPEKGSADVWAAFHAITDPAEKRKFWNEHRAEMVAAARSTNQ